MQIGPYAIERELGRGGMGAVYLGRTPGGDLVAIKVIHADLSLNEDLAARFEREGAALERLDHPNLVAIRGRGTSRGGHWLAMDYVAGGTLEERLKLKGPWPSHAARELLISLCEGITHAHEAGVLHRDLKPANVLLRAQDGQALIADFGLALPLDVSQHLTRTGEILGSPGFLAPEQCGLAQPTSPATDVYGLGALLYCVLTGQPPLTGSSLLGMLDNVLNQAPPPPSGLAENLDPKLEAICLRCLAKEPSERYQSVRELRDALQEEPAPTAQSKRGTFWAALAGLAALALLSGALLRHAPDLESAASSPPDQASPTPIAAPTPTATPAATPTAAPSVAATPTPTPITAPAPTPFDRALARRDWAGARTLLAPVTGVEGAWLRYHLLEAQLDWTGEETPAWRALKKEAAEQASSSPARGDALRRRRGVLIALTVLGDARLRSLESSSPQVLLNALEAGLPLAESPRQRAALWRAKASLQLAQANPDLPALFTAIRSWEGEVGKSWQSRLALSRAALRSGDRQRFLRALRDGERATYQVDHPWARYEFYLLRATHTAAPTRNSATLAQAFLDSEAVPSTLKAESALALASFLITDGADPARAAEVLRAHPVSEWAPKNTQATWWQASATVALATGDSLAIDSLLEQPDRSTLPARVYAGQLLQACAHALRQEPQRAREALELARHPGGVVPFLLILELQTAILTGSLERALQAARGIVALRRLPMSLRAISALEAMLALETTKGRPLVTDLRPAQRAAELINRALLPQRDRSARSLIKVGRWQAAIELTLRLHDPTSPPAEDERVFRICHLALRRGLGEFSPSSKEWQGARDLVSSFASRARSSKPKAALLALVESLEDVSPARGRELVTLLEQAARTSPPWEEFSAGVARLQRRFLREADPATTHARRAELLRTTKAWLRAFSTSIEANIERVSQLREPKLSQSLQALADQLPEDSPYLWRIRTDLLLVQFFDGKLSQEDLYLGYSGVLSTSRDPLRRERRRTLLYLAEGLRGSTDEVLGTQRLLDWLAATTGPVEAQPSPQDRVDHARYLRLRARLALARGDPKAALAIGEKLIPYLPLLTPILRARAEGLLAQAELELDRPSGLARLRSALAEAPFREGFLTLARHTSGNDQLDAFYRALAFPSSTRQVEELLREAEASKLDPAALLRRCLPIMEETPDRRPLSYAKALYAQRPGRDRALLLYETLRLERFRAPVRTSELLASSGPLFAEAMAQLRPETRALIKAQEALEEALLRSNAAEIRQALSRLRAAPASTLIADRLRAPLSIAEALQHPAMSQGDPSAVENAERELKAYLARGTAPLGLWTWFAETSRSRGEPERAREAIDAALEELPRAPKAPRARFLFQAALNAAALGEDDEALELLHETLGATETHLLVSAAKLVEAQVRVRRRELAAAGLALQVAFDFSPQGPASLMVQLHLAQGRLEVESGQLAVARASLRRAKSYPDFSSQAAMVLCFAKALEAAILSAEGDHQGALRESEAGLSLDAQEPFVHLTRLSALVGLGRVAEAKREARKLLDRSDLNPGPQAEVAAWLARAPK